MSFKVGDRVRRSTAAGLIPPGTPGRVEAINESLVKVSWVGFGDFATYPPDSPALCLAPAETPPGPYVGQRVVRTAADQTRFNRVKIGMRGVVTKIDSDLVFVAFVGLPETCSYRPEDLGVRIVDESQWTDTPVAPYYGQRVKWKGSEDVAVITRCDGDIFTAERLGQTAMDRVFRFTITHWREGEIVAFNEPLAGDVRRDDGGSKAPTTLTGINGTYGGGYPKTAAEHAQALTLTGDLTGLSTLPLHDRLARALFDDDMRAEAEVRANEAFNSSRLIDGPEAALAHVRDIMWSKTKPTERAAAEAKASRLVAAMGRAQ